MMPLRELPYRVANTLLPRTLFGRSLAIMITPLILAQLLTTWIFYDRHWEAMTARLAAAVAGDIVFIISQIASDTNEAERRDTVSRAARSFDLTILLSPGTVLPAAGRRPMGMLEETLAEALEKRVQRPFLLTMREATDWYEIHVQIPEGVLSILLPERRLFSPTTYIFILWMLGSSLVLFAIAIMFMRNQIRPIRRLALAAERFGKGRDVPNFRLEGALEVRQAAAAFLVMRERILRQIRQRTELLAGVSHDLRTPLTRMKLQLALMGDSPDVEELVADVSEMQAMVEGYLAFARGEGDESMQSTDLVRLIHEVAAGQRREGAEITLDLNASDIPMLPLRPNAMRRCLSNLVANARRHATHIWVSVVPRDYEMIDIFVDDNGSGIPRARREEVFKPFVRGDREQASPAGGTGLGLTIARDIARSHGGEITLADSPHGGLRAIIRLPL